MDLEILYSPATLRVLLLVVLCAPLGFAAVLALTGDRFKLARRLAGLFAVGHLAVTGYLVGVSCLYINSLGDQFGKEAFAGNKDEMKTFQPVAVPGDTGAARAISGGSQEHRTSWSLFTVGQLDPKAPNTPPAVQFFIGLDGLNVWLVTLTSLLTYLAVVLSWHSAKVKAGGYYAWVFVLQTAVTGAFVSFDVLLFYVFFELTLIPTFFLIGGWGVGGGKRDAARKFFLYTLLGSLFTLVGLIGIVYTNPTPVQPQIEAEVPDKDVHRGPVSFNVNSLIQNVSYRTKVLDLRVNAANVRVDKAAEELEAARKQNAPSLAAFETKAEEARDLTTKVTAERDQHKATQLWLFFALVAGFVVKVPLVPFHTWLPGAYSEAPAPITMLLSGLMAKLGTLGMLRVVIPLCPDAAVQYGLPVFGTLGAIGIVYASFCAFTQKDAKLMAAYSSVAHLGLLVLGLFALNTEGLTGATLHMVNHGLTAGAMFALLGFLFDRYRTTDMTQLGGLWKKYPKWAFILIFISLASVGLPGLNNFVTEMLLIAGLFKPWPASTVGYWVAVAAAAGILLSAWYTFTMIKRVLFGPLKEPTNLPDGVAVGDLSGRELWALSLLAVLCLALGVYPQWAISVSKGDVGVIEHVTESARRRANPDLAEKENPTPEKSTEITPGSTPPAIQPGGPQPNPPPLNPGGVRGGGGGGPGGGGGGGRPGGGGGGRPPMPPR